MKCPCCGYGGDELRVIEELHMVAGEEWQIKVTKMQARIVGVLLKHRPRVVPIDRMLMELYNGMNEPDNGYSAFQAQLHHIRKALLPHGVTIKNEFGSGYRLL